MKTSIATAQAIESISSPGTFETLALQVLRIQHEECRLLLHMGMNTEGKTTRGRLDAFCQVRGADPPRFVMAAFTTQKSNSLTKKWLCNDTSLKSRQKSGSDKDGDLIKAAQKARELQKSYPTATFVVYLCSNRILNDSLVTEVYATAEANGLNVNILEQSLIRDCLMTPEGQWLRQEYLGIQAELVSISLLKAVSQKSLQEYAKTLFLFPSTGFVETEDQRALWEAIGCNGIALHLVTGPSGAGKSTLCYQIFRNHLEKGGIGFYVPADSILNAFSFENAVEQVLQSLHPSIEKGAVEIVKGLAIGRKILIVIDHLTDRGQQPRLIQKIVTWTKPLQTMDDNSNQDSCWLILLPSSDAISIQSDDMDGSADWVKKTPINGMSVEEAAKCLREALEDMVSRFISTELENLVRRLGCLPILVQMFANSFRHHPDTDAQSLTHDVIARFVNLATSEAALQGRLLSADCDQALRVLTGSMVKTRDWAPSWEQVTSWLTERQVSAISCLIDLDKVCRIVKQDETSRFKFTHDFMLEHFLTDTLDSMLEDLHENDEFLSDPFYSLFLAPSIAKRSDAEDIVIWIREHNPLALIAAVKCLKTGNDNATSTLLGQAKGCLTELLSAQNTTSPITYEACRILSDSDSSFVLAVTEPVRYHRLIWRARLAHGDAFAGACELSGQELFWPSVRSDSLANILKLAKKYHYAKLFSGCEKMLIKPDLDKPIRSGALCLAGFIETDELCTSIKIAWDSDQDKISILAPSLWAAMRCGTIDPKGLLEPMIKLWSSLSEETTNGKMSQRRAITDNLRFAMRHVQSERVLKYLVQIAETNESLHEEILWMLKEVDHPVSVRFLVRVLAEREHIAEQQGEIWHEASFLRSRWDPISGVGNRLSQYSRDAIRYLWEHDENEEWLKKGAFDFWVNATDDLADLQGVPPNHPYFLKALWRRALLGDQSAAPYIEPLLVTNSEWFQVIERLWHNNFSEATNLALSNVCSKAGSDSEEGEINEHYKFARLLRDIPREDAEKLLVSNWENLRFSRFFVQLALYLGTEQCIRLASLAVEMTPPTENIFEHIGQFFGFNIQGLSDKLSKSHLENLQPFLQRIDDHTLASMLAFCHGHGYREWAHCHLLPEVDRRSHGIEEDQNRGNSYLQSAKRFFFPSDDELIADLNDIDLRQDWRISVVPWCERYELRQDHANRWRSLLEGWIAQSPSIRRLQIAGLIMCELGTREDLELLTKYDIEGPPGKVEQLIASVTYTVKRRSLN